MTVMPVRQEISTLAIANVQENYKMLTVMAYVMQMILVMETKPVNHVMTEMNAQ